MRKRRAVALISIGIETQATIYEIRFGYSSGRIETFVGEKLSSKIPEKVLINRKVGSDKAILNVASSVTSFQGFQALKPNGKLIEPEKPSLARYIDFLNMTGVGTHEVTGLDKLLRGIRYYQTRSANFYKLRTLGSESSYETRLSGLSQKLKYVSGYCKRRGLYQFLIEFKVLKMASAGSRKDRDHANG